MSVPTVRVADYNKARLGTAAGSISVTGSLVGMRELYGWPKAGQVRCGSYYYNVGPMRVQELKNGGLAR